MNDQIALHLPLYAAIALPMLFGYLLGSVPFGYLVSRIMYGVDIREHGSGNIGFTNVYRVLGFTPGAIVLVADIMKGWGAAAAAALVVTDAAGFAGGSAAVDSAIPVLAGLSAVVGHTFTLFLHFKGGKGVATAAGVILGIMPLMALVVFVTWLVLLLITRYVSVASLTAAVIFPVAVVISGGPPAHLLFALAAAFLVILRHRSNIGRLLRGQESRFEFKRSSQKPSALDKESVS